MLDLDRLFLLQQLALLGTISRVAEAQGLTRPAVSQQLLKLEAEAGTVLFERSGRGVKLTPQGQQLVVRSRELFALVENIEAEMEEASGRIAGRARIAAFGSAIYRLVPEAIRILAREHPDIDVEVREMESPDGLRAAAGKQIDVAVVDDLMNRAALIGTLQMLPLLVDEFLAALPARHPLARSARVSLAQLANDRWDLNDTSQGYQLMLLNECRAQGFEPQIRSSCRNIAATLELVKAAGVVAVLPSMALKGARPDRQLKLVRLAPALTRQIFLATVRESSRRPVIAAVIAALRRSARLLEEAGVGRSD